MADDGVSFPWARDKLIGAKKWADQFFRDRSTPAGGTVRRGALTFRAPAEPSKQTAAEFVTKGAIEGAQHALNWLEMVNQPATPGTPLPQVIAPRGTEDYRVGVLSPSDVAAPLGAGAMAAPFALAREGTTVGVFGGKIAAQNLEKAGRPTAVQALDMAERMEREGKSQAEIRQATNEFIEKNDPALGGVHKGIEGGWRFEVSDRESKLRAVGPRNTTLGKEFKHPELYQMDPDAAEMVLQRLPLKDAGGHYTEAWRGATFQTPPRMAISTKGSNAQQRGIAVHEAQHHLQDLDDLPRGTSPIVSDRWFPKVGNKERAVFEQAFELDFWRRLEIEHGHPARTPQQIADELEYFTPVRSRGALPPRPYSKEAIELASDPERLAAAREKWALHQKDAAYYRAAGEMEARQAQARADLTPAERRARHPDMDLSTGGAQPYAVGPQAGRYAILKDAEGRDVTGRRSVERAADEDIEDLLGGPRTSASREQDERMRRGQERWLKAKEQEPAPPEIKGQGIEITNNLDRKPGRFEYHIFKDGVRIGDVEGEVVNGIAHIEWLGALRIGGVRGFKALREHFRKDFPGVDTFTGERVSGAKDRLPDPTQTIKIPSVTGVPIIVPQPYIDDAEWEFAADEHAGRSSVRRVEVIEVDDSGPIQRVTVKGLDGEVYKLAMRGQGFGLTGVPKVGYVGYLYGANGRPDQAYLGNLEDPNIRPKDRAEGETVIYGDKNQAMEMTEGGHVMWRTPDGVWHSNP
jgi:hypothetical protein